MKKNNNPYRKLRFKAKDGLAIACMLFILSLIRNDFRFDMNLMLIPTIMLITMALLSPAIIVQIYDFKVRNPKPVFIEPTRRRMLLFGLVWSMFSLLLLVIIFGDYINDDNVGWLLGGWAIIALFMPLNIYIVNIYVRYKRLVEYGTAEWHKLKR